MIITILITTDARWTIFASRTIKMQGYSLVRTEKIELFSLNRVRPSLLEAAITALQETQILSIFLKMCEEGAATYIKRFTLANSANIMQMTATKCRMLGAKASSRTLSCVLSTSRQ